MVHIMPSVGHTVFIIAKIEKNNTYVIHVMICVRSASWLVDCLVWQKPLNVAVFLDSLNVINVKLKMMVQLIERCPFIPLSVTFIIFQGHSSVKEF